MSIRTLSGQTISGRRYNSTNTALSGSVVFASGDYLTIANNDAFKFGAANTTDFTVEFWVYPTATSTMAPVGVEYGTGYWAFFLNYSGGAGNGNIEFYATDSGQLSAGTGTLSANTWTHIAATRSGSTRTLWVNGVSENANSSAITLSPTNQMYIGKDPSLGRPFIGKISNLRIVKGTALYTAGFTPPTSPLTAIAGTTLLTCNSSSEISDSSTNNLTITTASGTPTPSSDNPFS